MSQARAETAPAFIDIAVDGRALRIEHAFVGTPDAPGPLWVFLHEGLGSLSMWRDFPARLCAALGARGLVYSRPGYGRSTPRAPDERWAPDFMHRQATHVLPALLRALGLDEADEETPGRPKFPRAPSGGRAGQARPLGARYVLFGHSDGASIALLHAAHFPQAVARAVLLAPHTHVETVALDSIARARDAYLDDRSGGLRDRLARHHADPDSAFWGWNGIWLDPAFRAWDIRAELAAITCPLLAVQGLDDAYGTLEQIRGIQRLLPAQTRLLELPACGHSPHRDQPQALIEAVQGFVR